MSQSWRMHFSLPYCLASHMATAQTEMEWVNGYGNHSHTSIQVICGRVWIESRLSGVSLIIPCYSRIYDKRRKKKSSAAFKEKEWQHLKLPIMCLPISTHCLVQGCLCCLALAQGLSVIQQSSQCREPGADAKVLLSKSVGTVSFNR